MAYLNNSLDDFTLKLLGTPPFANALQTVAVAAVGQYAKTALTWISLLKHYFHTHTTHHILAALNGKWNLHVFLMSLDTCLKNRTIKPTKHNSPCSNTMQTKSNECKCKLAVDEINAQKYMWLWKLFFFFKIDFLIFTL